MLQVGHGTQSRDSDADACRALAGRGRFSTLTTNVVTPGMHHEASDAQAANTVSVVTGPRSASDKTRPPAGQETPCAAIYGDPSHDGY